VDPISSQIALIDPANGVASNPRSVNPRVNGRLVNAAWSPDGHQLLYSVRRDVAGGLSDELYLRDERTGEERKLGSFPGIPRRATWTPDGAALVMPRVLPLDNPDIVRYSLADGSTQQLVQAKPGEQTGFAYPRLAPDGRTLYYLDSPPSGMAARLMRRDLISETAQSIATLSHVYDLAPDGEHLVIPVIETGTNQMVLRIITKDGKPMRDIVRFAPDERISGLCWSPDGKWIYFGRMADAKAELYRVSVGGGAPKATGLRVAVFADLAVHPKGDRIAYSAPQRTDLWRLDGVADARARLK